MNILKRLNDLSVDDLHQLQKTILKEIQRRKELSVIKMATAKGAINGHRSGEGRYSAPASKPVPAAARPATPRRAA